MGAGISHNRRLVLGLRYWKKLKSDLEKEFTAPSYRIVPFPKSRTLVVILDQQQRAGAVSVDVNLVWTSASNGECALLAYVDGRFSWDGMVDRVHDALKAKRQTMEGI